MPDDKTRQKNAKLAREVEKFPFLYNSELLPTYTRQEVTDEAWARISQVVDLPIHTCIERWANLRDGFQRSHREVIFTGKKRKHYLYPEMQFLIPYIKFNMRDRKQLTKYAENDPLKELNELNEDQNESEGSNSDSYPTGHSNKKKRDSVGSERNEPVVSELNDPIVSFLNSVVSEVNEMTLQEFKLLKRRALALIDEIKDVC